MNTMFEANYTGKLAWQLSIKLCVVHEAMNGCKKSKDSLKACFENVNIHVYYITGLNDLHVR